MQVGELSKATGVSIRSLRYYESKNLLRSRRLENGYRDFNDESIQLVKLIQFYLGLGLHTDQIVEIFNCNDHETLVHGYIECNELLDAYEEKLSQVKNQIKILMQIQEKIEK